MSTPKAMSVSFSVQATVTQTIKITDDRYTPEKILAGLQDGSITTTIAHKDNDETYTEVVHWDATNFPVTIGYVIQQDVSDNGTDVYADFE